MDWVDEDPDYITCSHPECKNYIKSYAWAKIKADGWFMQKDGTNYCPEHVPEWVHSWRKRKGW